MLKPVSTAILISSSLAAQEVDDRLRVTLTNGSRYAGTVSEKGSHGFVLSLDEGGTAVSFRTGEIMKLEKSVGKKTNERRGRYTGIAAGAVLGGLTGAALSRGTCRAGERAGEVVAGGLFWYDSGSEKESDCGTSPTALLGGAVAGVVFPGLVFGRVGAAIGSRSESGDVWMPLHLPESVFLIPVLDVAASGVRVGVRVHF